MAITDTNPSHALSYTSLFKQAWPIILANASVPLLGIVDTAVIGHTGDTEALGALAIGSLIISLIYWSFGFLRMGTTGFTAQAMGANNETEIRATLFRALILASIIGITLLSAQTVIRDLCFYIFDSSASIESLSADYFDIRIWAAPATLTTYALLGTLIGLGKSTLLLAIQLCLNGLNILLDIYFATYLEMGIQGVAIGTLIAEWVSCLLAFVIVIGVLKKRYQSTHTGKPKNTSPNGCMSEPFIPWHRLTTFSQFVTTLRTNADIMIRTFFLIGGFAWFNNQGAKLGNEVLAANHVLLQFMTFSAFFLDGYAHVVEAHIGNAIGARDRRQLRMAIWRSSVMAATTALILGICVLLGGEYFTHLLTDIVVVAEAANAFLIFCTAYIVLSFAAFQLDGIFIGAIESRAMRQASIASTLAFIAIGTLLTQQYDNTGLWLAMVFYVIFRALSLLFYLPKVFQKASSG